MIHVYHKKLVLSRAIYGRSINRGIAIHIYSNVVALEKGGYRYFCKIKTGPARAVLAATSGGSFIQF